MLQLSRLKTPKTTAFFNFSNFDFTHQQNFTSHKEGCCHHGKKPKFLSCLWTCINIPSEDKIKLSKSKFNNFGVKGDIVPIHLVLVSKSSEIQISLLMFFFQKWVYQQNTHAAPMAPTMLLFPLEMLLLPSLCLDIFLVDDLSTYSPSLPAPPLQFAFDSSNSHVAMTGF